MSPAAARDALSGPDEAALKALSDARLAYVATNGRILDDSGEDGPGRFLDRLEETAFPASAGWSDGPIDAALDRFCALGSPPILALVLRGRRALAAGDCETAARLLARAQSMLANDLHIQTLHRAAQRGGAADPSLAGRFCRAPFDTVETATNGDVYFCCPAWQPVPIGNLRESSADAIWNSRAAIAIRESIHDGSYRYCSRTHCPHLSGDTLPETKALASKRLASLAEQKATRLDHGPRRIVMAHDRSCNLSCPSCRTRLILARKDEQARLNAMADEVLLPLARDAERVRVTSSGDPFGSAHFRHVLRRLDRQTYPRLVIDIQTNGVLFDEEAWYEFDLAGRVGLVAVSIDATRQETYEIVRRGGSFDRLMANLAFLAGRRVAGEIGTLRLDFVIQALNFAEMPEMPALADRIHADGIKFQMIRNWRTYSLEAFAEQDIGSRFHPRYQDFLDVLRHPALAGPGIEMWGLETALRDAARPRQ